MTDRLLEPSVQLYKFTTEDGSATHGTGKWTLGTWRYDAKAIELFGELAHPNFPTQQGATA